jgi:hypothetical protein
MYNMYWYGYWHIKNNQTFSNETLILLQFLITTWTSGQVMKNCESFVIFSWIINLPFNSHQVSFGRQSPDVWIPVVLLS